MRNENRIPQILKRLEKVWEKYPDLRLGQLILNVCENPLLYYIEDEELLKLIEEVYMVYQLNWLEHSAVNRQVRGSSPWQTAILEDWPSLVDGTSLENQQWAKHAHS